MGISKLVEANGPIFLLIFVVLSLAGFALVVWRFLLNYYARTPLDDFFDRVEQEMANGGAKAAYKLCQEEPGVVPKLFVVALESSQQGKVAARNSVANCIELELMPSLNLLLPHILLLAKVAPMFGLLGTVSGMILAFQKIAGATKVDPSALANDIGMALFTTAEGLIIAIPLIFAYTIFRERVHRFEIDLQRGAYAAMELVGRMTGSPQR